MTVLAFVVAAAFSGAGRAQAPPTTAAAVPDLRPAPRPDAQAVVDDVVAAADRLLASLTDEQRQRLCFAFDDDAQRRRWSNLPTGLFERRGLRTGDLTELQRDAVDGLLAATLSPRGLREVRDTVLSDVHLHDRTGGGGQHVYGGDEFYVSLLGMPAADAPWMWQFGGHHLAVNATVAEGRITLSPLFTGGNPVQFDDGGRRVKHLGGNLDLAHALLASFTEAQRAQAVAGDRPAAVIHGPGRTHTHPHGADDRHDADGVPGAALNPAQQAALLALIEDRVGLLHPAHAEPVMRAIAESLDQTRFAWFGPTERDATLLAAGTYRVHGPAVLIEYSPRRIGPDGRVTHSHAVYRNPTNDYGRAWLTSDNE